VKICVVVPTHLSFQSGGAQYQVEQIVKRLSAETGTDVLYLARRFDPSFIPCGYRLRRIPPGPRLRIRGGRNLLDAAGLLRALRRFRPDAIYQRVGSAFTGVSAYYARDSRARLIWHVAHDNDVTPGKLTHAVPNPLVRRIEKKVLEYGVRHADVVVVQSQEQERLLRHYYKRSDSLLIRNFDVAPAEPLDKFGPKRVLWIANFKRWKRPELFISLAQKLAHLDGARFVMIGAPSGERQWQSSLERQIASCVNLDYLGELPQAQVNVQLSSAHLFVNTSESEGFPNTFIQAWYRQVPVLSLDVDPDGILEREQVGVRCATHEALVSAVEALLLDNARREEIGLRAARYAAENHSVANIERLTRLILSKT
jgi:glycosyltransferase involved in cell wall biosynthesis